MGQLFVGDTIEIEGPDGFSGTIGILKDRATGEPSEAVLIGGRRGTGRAKVVLEERASVWSLSVPARTGRVVFWPQVRTIEIHTGTSKRTITVHDRAAVRTLAARLRKDAHYLATSLAFFRAAAAAMVAAEDTYRVRFPILDETISSRDDFRQVALRGDSKHKPGKAGWVGVEVDCFIPCMEDCEEDVEWYEVWKHAYCLARCALKCGTAGGKLYPD